MTYPSFCEKRSHICPFRPPNLVFETCILHTDRFTAEDQSISRCQCCQIKTNSLYTLSTPTPYQANMCPSDQYSSTLQLRLLNADYDTWVQNPGFVTDLKQQVVTGINQYCKCGFNAGYLKGEPEHFYPLYSGVG